MAAKEQLTQILRNFRSRTSAGGYTEVNHSVTDQLVSMQSSKHALKLCEPHSKEYYKLKQLLNRYA